MARKIVAELRSQRSGRVKARPALEVAQRLRREGNLDAAEQIYRAHALATPNEAEAWIGLAQIAEARGQYAQAATWASKAIRARPTDIWLLEYLGTLFLRARDYPRATKVYRGLIQRAPSNIETYFALAAIEREMGKAESAQRTLEKAVLHASPTVIRYGLVPTPVRVLRFYGLQNAHHRLLFTEDGRATIYLHLGNFSTDQLINQRDFTTITYYLRKDTLDRKPLPPHDIRVNAIADPDVEAESLTALLRHIEISSDKSMINDPRRVLETSRDSNFRRLQHQSDVRFPATVRVLRSPEGTFDLDSALQQHGLAFPLILRVPGTHTGETVRKVETMAEAHRYLAETEGNEIYAIEWIDCRYRDAFYRKMRLFFVDGKPYPVVHHIDEEWNVHGGNRRRVMATHAWMMEIERSFLDDPASFVGPKVWSALQRLPALVGLDFFGVDFSVTESGQLLIYEMNPCMRHSYDHARAFPYLRPHLQRISDAFRDMLLARADEHPNVAR